MGLYAFCLFFNQMFNSTKIAGRTQNSVQILPGIFWARRYFRNLTGFLEICVFPAATESSQAYFAALAGHPELSVFRSRAYFRDLAGFLKICEILGRLYTR